MNEPSQWLLDVYGLASDRDYFQAMNVIYDWRDSLSRREKKRILKAAADVAINECENRCFRSAVIKKMKELLKEGLNIRSSYTVAIDETIDEGWYAYVGNDDLIHFARTHAAACA